MRVVLRELNGLQLFAPVESADADPAHAGRYRYALQIDAALKGALADSCDAFLDSDDLDLVAVLEETVADFARAGDDQQAVVGQQVFRSVATAAAADDPEAQRVQQRFIVRIHQDACPFGSASVITGVLEADTAVERTGFDRTDRRTERDALQAGAAAEHLACDALHSVVQDDLSQPGAVFKRGVVVPLGIILLGKCKA